MKHLSAPLDEDTVRGLELGETVSISGPVVTGRDEVHIRALEYAERGEQVPSAIRGAVLYHCGPIMRREGGVWKVIAAGPTTSARMNSL